MILARSPMLANKTRICKSCGAAAPRGSGIWHYARGLLCQKCWSSHCQAHPHRGLPKDETIRRCQCGAILSKRARFCPTCTLERRRATARRSQARYRERRRSDGAGK